MNMLPMAEWLLIAAQRLPLPNGESYAGTVNLLRRAAWFIRRQDNLIEKLQRRSDIAYIEHRGKVL